MKTQEELYREIEKLKEVNLIDFAIYRYGYFLDEKRTRQENKNFENPKYVFLENKDGDRLLISRKRDSGNDTYLYKNIFNDFDKGNIFSMIKYREEKYSIPYSKKVIKNFVKNIEKGYYKETSLKITLDDLDLKNINAGSILKIKEKHQVLPDFKHFEYLIGRGLNKELLTSTLCEGRIKNEIIYGKKLLSGSKAPIEKIYTVFPVYGLDGDKTYLCGLVRKGPGMKGNFEYSMTSLGVWASNYRRNEPVTHLVLAESPIDALSYCQLKIDYKKENPLLLSTNGQISTTQLSLIQTLINKLQPLSIVFGFDNAVSGQIYSAKVLAHVSAPLPEPSIQETKNETGRNDLNSLHISAGSRNKLEGEITFKIEHDNIQSTKITDKEKYISDKVPQLLYVQNYFHQKNKDLFLENDECYSFKILSLIQDHHTEIKILFHNSVDNWNEINKGILELKFLNDKKIVIDIPQFKDFNEDLKDSLGILDKNREANIQPFEESNPLNDLKV